MFNFGSVVNDNMGDIFCVGGFKINDNFNELYVVIGNGVMI